VNKYLFILFLLITGTFNLVAQRWKVYRHEYSLGIGSAHYFGDIGGTASADNLMGLRDIRLNETKYTVQLGWNYRYTRDISVRYNVNYIALSASDEGSRNASRGLSFYTHLVEFGAQAQYYLKSEYRRKRGVSMFNRRGAIASTLQYGIYVFGGIHGSVFFPHLSGPSELLNVDNNFRKTTHYSKVNVVIPFGIGGQYVISKRWLIALEITPHICVSDYIDGMWTTWSRYPDIYWTTSLRGVYKIRTDRYGYPVFLKKGRGI